jgi:hypothetical protein
MLAKITAKNQLTLPQQAIEVLGDVSHVNVEIERGRLVLTPARPAAGDVVREKLLDLHLTEADIAAAVTWARQKP